ncbi:MAG: NAD(P)/FAD-dependent oxidoreductase [Desulfovibrio sp.]|jgi:dihydrolipoamide dehydrogenase|nr:NAD(P)/FAD-dependent oxidoreductase [Desulfovibrio sp.]
MSTQQHFDLVILGGGPAGTRAAFDAAGAGMKTALVEPAFLGGACLNVGCIPTKYLLGASAAIPLLAVQRKYKVMSGGIHCDFAAAQSRKDRFIKGSRQSLEKKLLAAGITLFRGRGGFSGPRRISVKGKDEAVLSFGDCIVATGSVPSSFPGLKPDGASVRSSAGILGLGAVPESLIIVGGGAIGLELGELYHRLGCRITLAEVMPRILPGEDEDVSEAVGAYCKKEGWTIHAGRRIASLSTVDGQSLLRFEDGEEIRAETSLLAIGRKAMTAPLAPGEAGLALSERGWLATDEYLRCAEHVYAVGDVNGRTLLAHAADHQARHAVSLISGATKGAYAPPAMPSCVYGTMEVMRVGPTVAELRKNGAGKLSISRAPLAANAIAQSYGHSQGFARMVWEGDALRGVCAVGHGVSHLVGAASLLLALGVEKNIAPPVIFAHPTLDEVLESAMVATRESIQ